jgi:hypothetical protein
MQVDPIKVRSILVILIIMIITYQSRGDLN